MKATSLAVGIARSRVIILFSALSSIFCDDGFGDNHKSVLQLLDSCAPRDPHLKELKRHTATSKASMARFEDFELYIDEFTAKSRSQEDEDEYGNCNAQDTVIQIEAARRKAVTGCVTTVGQIPTFDLTLP